MSKRDLLHGQRDLLHGVGGGELGCYFVSVRTNKRHHHHHTLVVNTYLTWGGEGGLEEEEKNVGGGGARDRFEQGETAGGVCGCWVRDAR
jgi:hypothetical protein